MRGVEQVDEEKRQIWFQASGMYPGKDPYFIHYYRINFDGTGLIALTEADGKHTRRLLAGPASTSSTRGRASICRRSRELRRTRRPASVMELERGGHRPRCSPPAGKRPKSFIAKGRDGKTDIWGIIYPPDELRPDEEVSGDREHLRRPAGLVRAEDLQRPTARMQALAELGFIVVQIDGMGTPTARRRSTTSRGRTSGDAGFPDRILWHKAVAAKYPWYDITRVGIYGTSAGGQNSLGALLFHPEFYKVGGRGCGCHDNRMDKIWWNEQWMGWPVGPHTPRRRTWTTPTSCRASCC